LELDGTRKRTYSHSIINEPSKLLIHKGFDAASTLLTVTFTVNQI